MWPFARRASKEDLLGLRRVVVKGMAFTIRRINPLLDFRGAEMPQIFSGWQSRRKQDPSQEAPEAQVKKAVRDMHMVVEAGVYEPKLVPVGQAEQRGREPGITVEDVFRDPELGIALYWEILNHTLNKFRGIRGVFFSMLQRLRLLTLLRSATESSRATSRSAGTPA